MLENIITKELVDQAIVKASKHKLNRSEVQKALKNKERLSDRLYESILDGTYSKYIRYTDRIKIGHNKKVRHIKMPSFKTLSLQHLCIFMIKRFYDRVDNLNGLNCKEGCGITSKNRRKSVLKRVKHIFFDKRDANYLLIIDQRKCYEHISPSIFRAQAKKLIPDHELIDFIISVCFFNKKLPIGAPTSSLIHHVIMLRSDYFVRSLVGMKGSVRYADDNLIAFDTKENANTAKWRIMNFWWYEYKIRNKSLTTRVIPIIQKNIDFCGFVFNRNLGKKITDHNKGYVKIRCDTLTRLTRVKDIKALPAYLGLIKQSDSYNFLKHLSEHNMKLLELTRKIKIERKFDADNIDIKDLIGKSFVLIDYEIREKDNKPSWMKCLVGLTKDVSKSRKEVRVYEFHGNFQYLMRYLLEIEKKLSREDFLPITDCSIEDRCGYIFKGSTKVIDYINLKS